MQIALMAGIGGLVAATGIVAMVLRKKGKFFAPSREERETEEGLRKAFGDDMRWGAPGATESEWHDSHSHGGDASSTD